MIQIKISIQELGEYPYVLVPKAFRDMENFEGQYLYCKHANVKGKEALVYFLNPKKDTYKRKIVKGSTCSLVNIPAPIVEKIKDNDDNNYNLDNNEELYCVNTLINRNRAFVYYMEEQK